MTESEMWQMLKPKFDGLGTVTRLENTATSGIPDVLLVSGGVFVFIELKVQRTSTKITCPPFQWAYAMRVSHHLRRHNHWYFVGNERHLPMRMYTFEQLKTSNPVYANGHLEISLEGITPEYVLEPPFDVMSWIKYVEDKEYG